jgi:Flp pilus assembly protein TadG
MKTNYGRKVGKLVSQKIFCQEGGAIIEFVALALPLFLPVFIFLNQYGQISDTEASLRTLAREISRAIVTSENDLLAERVAREVFIKGGAELGFQEEIERRDLVFTVKCRAQPCLTPNNQIQVNVHSSSLRRTISAVAYVSPWA